jgi:hypothetical protein
LLFRSLSSPQSQAGSQKREETNADGEHPVPFLDQAYPEWSRGMMPLLLLAAASADLDALDQAVARCDRNAVNPVLSGEAARRSQFLLDAYHEQEAIVNDRLALADQRRTSREAGPVKAAEEKQLELQEAAIEDRQKALNDKRMLEGIRQDATDTMRRYFLNNCPAGKDIGH